jgi:hypothetical protein
MTLDLNAIRKRAEASSSGPWHTYENYRKNNSEIITNSRHAFVAKVFTGQTDAEFIAHARQDVPALLAEVERLRVIENMHEEAIAEDHATKERLLDIIAEKDAEVDRLRTANAKLIAELERADKFSDKLKSQLRVYQTADFMREVDENGEG